MVFVRCAQHMPTNGQTTVRSRFFLTRTRLAFVQYGTDIRQTKIAVCSLARASGESNAHEWWVPVRVFSGAESVGGVLPGCVLSVAFRRPWANDYLQTRRISEPACRFGVISVQEPLFDKTRHWSLWGQSPVKRGFSERGFSASIRPGLSRILIWS